MNLTCALCGEKIRAQENGWAEGHNGWPLCEGRVCGACNTYVVLARVAPSLAAAAKSAAKGEGD